MSHNFFSSSPIGIPFKNMDGSHPYEGPRVGLSPIEAGKTKLWIVLVCARYVSDQATRTSNFSPPAASRYSAARRLEEMSSTSLSSCGRVIGEPWKSKILMKGLPYTYRIWPRKMSVVDCWIKIHAQIQVLVKKSDPPSNFDTGGSINSQNKWSFNGTFLIDWSGFRCTLFSYETAHCMTLSQSWSPLGHFRHGKCAPVGIMRIQNNHKMW